MKKIDKRARNFRLRAVLDGVLAQLVEHHNGIVGVESSSLSGSTILQSLKSTWLPTDVYFNEVVCVGVRSG
jgi:hypothetical protein